MDPQQYQEFDHRDDWQAFKESFGAWWQRYGNKTLLVILVTALAVTVVRVQRIRAQDRHESAWMDLANTTSPEVARTTAPKYDEPVRSLLYLRAGDMLLAQAAKPREETPATPAPAAAKTDTPTDAAAGATDAATPSPTGSSVSVAPAEVVPTAQLLTQAGEMYSQVANNPAVHEVVRLNAQLGLGAVAEAQQNWDAARDAFTAVRDAARGKYAVLAAQAEGRLEMLPRLRHPVRYASEAPAPQPALPAINVPQLDLSAPVPAPASPGTGADSSSTPEPKLPERTVPAAE